MGFRAGDAGLADVGMERVADPWRVSCLHRVRLWAASRAWSCGTRDIEGHAA